MSEFRTFDKNNKPSEQEKESIIDFLYTHLEDFGDDKDDISKCVDYAIGERPSFGGFITNYYEDSLLLASVIINKTGMDGYIPANILVYIATHNKHRGKGIGKKLIKKVIDKCEGGIALHVEPNNPAKFLYEKLGFTNKYLEMRLTKNK